MRNATWTILAGLMLLGGCVAPVQHVAIPATLPALRADSDNWIRTELYFGLTRRDGSAISEERWRAFVTDVITPAFPDGFSVVRAEGQYLDDNKVLHVEPSRVVVLLHPRSGAVDTKIDKLIAIYLDVFDQESVMRVESNESVSFVRSAGK